MRVKMLALAGLLSLLLLITGCSCDGTCDCRSKSQTALDAANTALNMATATAPVASTASPAGQAAQMVLRDVSASQERKSQALQLLFELERNERLEQALARVDELSAELKVLLERKVETDAPTGR